MLLPMVLTNDTISGPCTFIYAHVRHREKIHECAFCGVSDQRLSVCSGCKLQVHRLNEFRPYRAKHMRMAHVRGPETQMDEVSS